MSDIKKVSFVVALWVLVALSFNGHASSHIISAVFSPTDVQNYIVKVWVSDQEVQYFSCNDRSRTDVSDVPRLEEDQAPGENNVTCYSAVGNVSVADIYDRFTEEVNVLEQEQEQSSMINYFIAIASGLAVPTLGTTLIRMLIQYGLSVENPQVLQWISRILTVGGIYPGYLLGSAYWNSYKESMEDLDSRVFILSHSEYFYISGNIDEYYSKLVSTLVEQDD